MTLPPYQPAPLAPAPRQLGWQQVWQATREKFFSRLYSILVITMPVFVAVFLAQEGGLFDSLNIEENVSYPLINQPRHFAKTKNLEERVRESLRFVELEHTLDKFPAEPSSGMKRRVGIARAVTSPAPSCCSTTLRPPDWTPSPPIRSSPSS